jgi:hypothetical protein
VQPINVWPNEIVPLLDAIGGRGVYVLGLFASEEEVEQALRMWSLIVDVPCALSLHADRNVDLQLDCRTICTPSDWN